MAVRALRVALLTETFLPEVGGGERQAELLSRGLTRRGHHVTVVTRRSRHDLPLEEVVDGVRLLRVGPAGPGRWKKWGLAGSALTPLWRVCAEIDVVLVSGYRIIGSPALGMAHLYGRPCVLKADSPGEMSGDFFRAGLATLHLQPTSPAVRPLLRWRNAALRRADAFVAISHEIAGELQGAGVRAERIHYVPNGVDTTRFRPATSEERATLRGKLGLPDGPIAIYTGRLVSYKGLPVLLRAWGEVHGSGTATLLLVGSGSADMHNCEHELRTHVHGSRLADSVRFTGPVDDVHEYLRAADVFVFPTEKEAFGVSLVEAMACGLPCVSTVVGGIRDFLADGQNGIRIEPADVQSLATALITLLRGGDRAAELGRAARRTVLERFSEDAVTEGYVRVFESALEKTSIRDRRPEAEHAAENPCPRH